MKDTLIEGFKAGEGEVKLAERVDEVMTLAKRQRAETIARTELFGITNASHYMTLVENGIEWKEWLTAGDERVRDTHAAADRQRVHVNEPFIVGGEALQYPGDPAGSAENVVNCRCVVIPVVE